MPSSYQKRLDENNELCERNNELRERNNELLKQLEEMKKAIHILNKCIINIDHIRIDYHDDLRYEYDKLCKEMKEN